jgi:hypothetical protein
VNVTYRLINSDMWADPWFEEQSSEGKLFFIYLFTNGSCNQAGVIPQFSSKRVAFETGIDRAKIDEMVLSFSRDGKIVVEGTRVACIAFAEHQVRNGNFAGSARKAIDELPEGTMKKVLSDRQARWKQPPSNPEATPKQPLIPPPTGQDRTGELQNKKEIARSDKPKRAVALVDDEFIAEIKGNKAYVGIDIEREHGKMLAWILTPRGHGKLPTRQRFINWLSKVNPSDSKADNDPYRITTNTFED